MYNQNGLETISQLNWLNLSRTEIQLPSHEKERRHSSQKVDGVQDITLPMYDQPGVSHTQRTCLEIPKGLIRVGAGMCVAGKHSFRLTEHRLPRCYLIESILSSFTHVTVTLCLWWARPTH